MTSLCPKCYQEIPASVVVGVSAIMNKTCPVCGDFESMVEPDGKFYTDMMNAPNKSIYNGLLVDITDDCNLNCDVCLHGGDKGNYSIESIVKHCEQNKKLQPFFLSGGEPTIHPQFIEIFKAISSIGGTGVITNGIKFTDVDYLSDFCQLVKSDILPIALSVHPEIDVLDTICNNLRTLNKKLSAVFWVITDLSQIETVVETFKRNADVIDHIRIKAATNIWNTSCVKKPIFVSDMLHKLEGMGNVEIDLTKGNKPSVINVVFEGLKLMLVSWYNVNNIDLEDINCPPYYMSKDGVVRDFVKACLINEGIDKGLL